MDQKPSCGIKSHINISSYCIIAEGRGFGSSKGRLSASPLFPHSNIPRRSSIVVHQFYVFKSAFLDLAIWSPVQLPPLVFVLFCNLKYYIGKNSCQCCFYLGLLDDHLSRKNCSVGFQCQSFQNRSQFMYMYIYCFPFCLDGRLLDSIVVVPDLCLSVNFTEKLLIRV